MAVDTRQKRFSMLNISNPVPHAIFEADGTVDADDRAFNLNLYSGISLSALALSISCTLVSRTGAALPSLTLLSWAWFDATDPNTYGSPSDQGQTETTDATGLIEIDLPNTTLTDGQEGTLVLRSDDGTSLGAYNLAVSA